MYYQKYICMKQELLLGLEPYRRPEAEILILPEHLSFLREGFSARFLKEEDILDWEYWEGHELDIL